MELFFLRRMDKQILHQKWLKTTSVDQCTLSVLFEKNRFEPQANTDQSSETRIFRFQRQVSFSKLPPLDS